MTPIAGKAWVFGSDIGTDLLAPGLYMKRPIEEIARHCLEDVDPRFAGGVEPGDVVVAGRNFGMGSSREQAAEALRHLGVSVVLAQSYGGLFYRNALNLGLLVLICPKTNRIEAHLMAMVQAGGLVPYLERRLKAKGATAAANGSIA